MASLLLKYKKYCFFEGGDVIGKNLMQAILLQIALIRGKAGSPGRKFISSRQRFPV